MKFVLAPESFKESMTAPVAADAMKRGIRAVFPSAECVCVPMADGGEGTCVALTAALGGTLVEAPAVDALGRPLLAEYGYVAAESLAIIEIAAAAGIHLITPAERDPLVATSFGVGLLILDAVERGARRFIVGLGGSATNDGGAGMLQALGVTLRDAAGIDLAPGGAALATLERIDVTGLDSRVAASSFLVASDVTSPLLGPDGASAVYGPQKGADAAAVATLEDALTTFAHAVTRTTGRVVAHLPGAGAAGGLGAAFLAFLGAELRPGVDVVLEATRLADHLRDADAVFTGEGSLDSQTLAGKTPFGVARLAHRMGVPVIGFGGRLGEGSAGLLAAGFAELVVITPDGSDVARALSDGAANLERTVAAWCRGFTLPAGEPAESRPGG